MRKEIIGYDGLYEIDVYGSIYNKDKALKVGLSTNGYKYVTLYKNNKRNNFTIHRLIAIHFIENNDNNPCVNHKDGNKLNNNIENLEWCTYSENQQHAYDTGLHKPHNKKINHGEKSALCKVSDVLAREIFNHKGTQRSIALKYGISQTQVFRIKNKQRRQSLWS